MHVGRKRKKRAMDRRKDQAAALGYVDKPFDQLALANHVRRQGSAAGSSRSYSSVSGDSNSYRAMEMGQNTATNTTDHASSANRGKIDISIPIDNLIGRVLKNPHDHSTKISHSCRSTETEILSPGTTPDRLRRWSIIGDSMILSLPVATASAENVVERIPLLSAHIGVDDSAIHRQKGGTASKVKNRAYRKGNYRRISTNIFKPETPATITLRKASNKYHREQPRRLSQNEKAHVAKRRTAKDSKPIGFLSGECLANNPQGDNTTLSTHHGQRNEVFAVSRESPRSYTLLAKSTSSSDQLILRRRTIAADPALTFAEVHTTPEVFSPGGASRKHSLLAIETMRRSSAVMIRSGGSIHEIIWDKDDAPSSSSSRPSLSQPGSGCSSETRSLDGSSPTTTVEHHRFQNPDFSKPAFIDADVSSNTEGTRASEEAAGRPWTGEQAVNNLENLIETPAVNKILKSKVSSRTKSQRRGRWAKSWKANVSNSMQGVESFPPLLERGSTYEWRKAPLVDITDVSAGRSSEASSKTNTVDTEEAQAEQRDLAPRKQSGTTYHGTWTSGQLGTALGTSSHHRRPSTGPHQQGPYNSLVDLSKSVSRRASQITHSLSDKALDWAADRHEPLPTRRLSKSADPLCDLTKPLVGDNTEPQRSILQGSYAVQRMAPVWRKNSHGGLWINTASMLPDSRVLRVAGLSEVAEDEVEYGA
ncbi:hypothetical protein MMC17_010231 [Xylographa soralifera]|nr:hypothetical protein [Xylographa soralifera]